MFDPINFIDEIWFQQHIPSKLEWEQEKTGKEVEYSKNTCLEHSAGNWVDWKPGASVMIGYTRGIKERLSHSQAIIGQW